MLYETSSDIALIIKEVKKLGLEELKKLYNGNGLYFDVDSANIDGELLYLNLKCRFGRFEDNGTNNFQVENKILSIYDKLVSKEYLRGRIFELIERNN